MSFYIMISVASEKGFLIISESGKAIFGRDFDIPYFFTSDYERLFTLFKLLAEKLVIGISNNSSIARPANAQLILSNMSSLEYKWF